MSCLFLQGHNLCKNKCNEPKARTFKLWKGSAHKKGALRASIERILMRPKAILRSYIARWRRAAAEIGAAQRLVHALSLHWQRSTKQAFHVWAWVRTLYCNESWMCSRVASQ